MQFILYAVLVFVAALLQAWLGFGFPVIAMAFLPMLVGYAKAVALVQCVAMISVWYLAIKYFKKIRWDVLLPLLIPSIIISCIVTYFSLSVDSTVLFILLGCCLILLAVYSLVLGQKLKINPTKKTGILMGVIGGIGNGLFSIGGPTTALYLLPALNDKIEYMACIQTYFALTNVLGLIIRISGGSLGLADWKYVVIGWAAMIAGTLSGQKGFSKIDSEKLKKAIYIFICCNGIWIILTNTFFK